MKIYCTHCHQTGERGATIVVKDSGITTPRCALCGAPLFELKVEVLPEGTLAKAVEALKELTADHFDTSVYKTLIAELEELKP